MRRLLLWVALAVATGQVAVAAPVDSRQAAALAQAFWRIEAGRNKAVAPEAERLAMAEWPYGGMYLFVHPEGGFVIVSGNDAAEPVLGYSLQSPIDGQHLPEGLAALARMWQEQFEALAQQDAKRHPQWDALLNGQPLKALGEAQEPLVTAMWNQTEPYNDLCPLENGEHTCTGCAATAQAMMMNYWKHPAIGTGRHSYIYRSFGTIEADFGITEYDWSHMTDSPTAASSPEERHAVAELMFHVGVGNEMGYGLYANGGSGAFGLSLSGNDASINRSLWEFFHYDKRMRAVSRTDAYDDARWRDTLMAELDLQHPIVYCASDNLGGHAFICDGYNEQGMMHFNFGWSGAGNGYFTVGNISPQPMADGSFSRKTIVLLGAVPDPSPIVGDTVMAFGREGGLDSLHFCIGRATGAWSMTTDADWLTLADADFDSVGWVKMTAQSNNSGAERLAIVTFERGGYRTHVRVVQTYFDSAEYCPLTVMLESSEYPAWRNGAYVTLESALGLVYGSGTLRVGGGLAHDTLTFSVSPTDAVLVFHPGGNSDRFINYKVANQYGEVVVDIVNAQANGGRHPIVSPCEHYVAGVDDAEGVALTVMPNPASAWIELRCADPIVGVTAYDMQGRATALHGTGNGFSINPLAPGIYMLRITLADGQSVSRKLVVAGRH